MDWIVGREQELAAVRGFADALVVEGDPGIGKTSLWLAGTEAAAEGGALVLQARPVEAEATLPFTGLCDLCAGLERDMLPALPDPQRHSLEAALMLASPAGAGLEPLAVAVALLSGLRALARDRPVLVAVDDVQWLDAPTAAAVGYAARRLAGEPVRFLFALRRQPGGALPPVLEPLRRDERLARVEVGPLSLAATHRLLNTRLGLTMTRPVLRRLHEAAGGNPFTALELGRAVAAAPEPPAPGDPLPAPRQVRELVRDRLAGLPAPTLDAVLAAAMLAAPSLDELDVTALEPALAAELVVLEGDRVRFVHPLYASGVTQLAGEQRRRAMHLRLADVVEDREERALHLALAATRPDEAVAAALEDAARAASGRGAPGAAADLLERALRLTPPGRDDDAERRRHDASQAHWIAGDDAHAARLLEEAVAVLAPGAHRARALTRLARLRKFGGLAGEAVELDRRALAEPGNDLRARAEAHEDLAWTLVLQRRDLRAAARHGRAGARLAEALGDAEQLMDACSVLGQAEFLLGGGLPSPATERAVALAGEAGGLRTLRHPAVHAALLLACADELDEAREAYETMRRRAQTRGDEQATAWVLARLALVECLAGRWEVAGRHARAGLDVTGGTAQWMSGAALLAVDALLAALRGDAGRARELGGTAARVGEEMEAGIVLHLALWAQGAVELAADDPAAAERHLSRLWAMTDAAGIGDPGERRFAGDLVETWLALGRPDDAVRPIEWLEQRGEALRRPSALAVAARGRGLLAPDVDEALVHFERALAEHARAPLPFERARTVFARGAVLRRAKRKREARETLGEALAEFRALGAALWASRTESELRRISGRAPGAGELTTAERRIAELVAEGRTNREVAALLFLSERTVESHLSRVYGKLGVRSRTELAGRYAQVR